MPFRGFWQGGQSLQLVVWFTIKRCLKYCRIYCENEGCQNTWCWKVLSPTTPEIIDQIHELILEDRRISAKSIAEQLGIWRERVGFIIHEDLDKLAAFFLPGRAKDFSAPLLTNYNTCTDKTKNIRTSSMIQMISHKEIQRVEFHSDRILSRLISLLFLNTSNCDSVKWLI
jgi:dGTP triphosphohydrolase